MSKEAMKLALDALEKLVRFESDSWELGSCRIAGQATKALREALAEQPAQLQPVRFKCTVIDDVHPEGVPLERWGKQPAQQQQEPVLQDIEQYRLQMASISTAAIGYWKESDGILPDYDTVALRDVAKLYAKYDELYRAQPAQKEPVAIKYWLQDTMESGRWVTTDNMAKATAERMLSGEYGDVYPQGRIVEPSPPAQGKPLTDVEVGNAFFARDVGLSVYGCFLAGIRHAEAAHGIKEKNT